MRFRDELTLTLIAGKGGDGAVSFRREKYVPKGGPDGGNGGRGGAVILVADPGSNTLHDLSFNPVVRAKPGENGSGNRCDGKDAEDVLLTVPVGTQVFYESRDGETLAADLAVSGARWIAARGGLGGKGNAHFATPTNQAPTHAQGGRLGEELRFRLVLKSVADVGLAGLPNVGKSTLISAISNARPLVADYPFTTLEPHLGVVTRADGPAFVVADIPGLIPGAHLGKGLGMQFLRHIERTRAIAQVIDLSTNADGSRNTELLAADEPDVEALARAAREQFELINSELGAFSEDLAKLPRVIVFSKADLGLAAPALAATADYFQERGFKTLAISAATGQNLEELKSLLGSLSASLGV